MKRFNTEREQIFLEVKSKTKETILFEINSKGNFNEVFFLTTLNWTL